MMFFRSPRYNNRLQLCTRERFYNPTIKSLLRILSELCLLCHCHMYSCISLWCRFISYKTNLLIIVIQKIIEMHSQYYLTLQHTQRARNSPSSSTRFYLSYQKRQHICTNVIKINRKKLNTPETKEIKSISNMSYQRLHASTKTGS